jgi:hypothetical protein
MRALDCDSMEKLVGAPDRIRDYPMSDLLKAIEMVKKLKITKAVKAAKKIMGDRSEWGAKEPEWLPFEELRKGPFKAIYIRDTLSLVHSPVEVWMVFRRTQGLGDTVRHIVSLLTGESYYTLGSYMMLEATGSDLLPKTRSSLSTISSSTTSHVRATQGVTPTPIIKQIIAYA